MKWLRNSSFCSLNLIKPIIMSPHSERHHSLYYPTINYSQQEYLKLELPILRWMYATKARMEIPPYSVRHWPLHNFCVSPLSLFRLSLLKLTNILPTPRLEKWGENNNNRVQEEISDTRDTWWHFPVLCLLSGHFCKSSAIWPCSSQIAPLFLWQWHRKIYNCFKNR
mgnify:CR=1 FL=1